MTEPTSSVTAGPWLRIATWWLVVVVVAAAAGAVMTAVSATVYGARSEILITSGSPDTAPADRDVDTAAAVADSQAVLQPVASSFGMSVRELRKHLDVSLVGRSAVLRLTYANTDAAAALSIDEAITTSYLAVVNEQAPGAERALGLLGTLESALGRLEDAVGTTDVAALIDDVRTALADLRTELEDQTDFGLPQARLLTASFALDKPVSRGTAEGGVLGAGVGLLLGVGLAFWLTRRRRTAGPATGTAP